MSVQGEKVVKVSDESAGEKWLCSLVVSMQVRNGYASE